MSLLFLDLIFVIISKPGILYTHTYSPVVLNVSLAVGQVVSDKGHDSILRTLLASAPSLDIGASGTEHQWPGGPHGPP